MTITFVAGQTLTALQTNTELANPTGMLAPFAGSTQPTGWLLCDGTAKSTATYPDLFAVIGYTYGGSAGSFYLPDMRGRVPMGAGTGAGLNASGTGVPAGSAQTARALGAWGGEETHLLSSAEMPAHTHPADWSGFGVGNGDLRAFSGAGTDTHRIVALMPNTGSAGGGGRHAVVPPFVVLHYIIKT